MAFDEMTAQAMRDVARLEQRIAKLEDALFGVLKWDEARGYIVPYRVRDPILALLNERPNAGVAIPFPTFTAEEVQDIADRFWLPRAAVRSVLAAAAEVAAARGVMGTQGDKA